MYPQGRSHVPRGVSNTTSNTTKKTTSKTTSNAAPVVPTAPASSNEIKEDVNYEYLGSLKEEDFAAFDESAESLNYDYLANKAGVVAFASPKETATESRVPRGNMAIGPVRDAAHYFNLKKQRPLTPEEQEDYAELSRAYSAQQEEQKRLERKKQLAAAGLPADWDEQEW